MKKHLKRAWKFLWDDDSVASWIANLVIAFVVIRWVIYPVLGIVLGTSFPIVAVVSESMEHGLHNNLICGNYFDEFKESYDNWWDVCGKWYENQGISKEQFKSFSLPNGFDKGDVIVLWRANPENIKVGDVLVFQAGKPQPIIHRVVKTFGRNSEWRAQTKGDHNSDSVGALGENSISEERLLGKAILRIPYLGWIKILFVDAVRPLGIIITR